jgi:hypothetical protein
VRRPRSCSANLAASRAGLTSLFMFLREETTAFFRSNFNSDTLVPCRCLLSTTSIWSVGQQHLRDRSQGQFFQKKRASFREISQCLNLAQVRPPPGLPQRQLFRIQQTCPARASLKASSTRVQCNASSTASAPGAEHNITCGMLARTLRVITSRSRYQRNRR